MSAVLSLQTENRMEWRREQQMRAEQSRAGENRTRQKKIHIVRGK
jgi:ribosomal protein L4